MNDGTRAEMPSPFLIQGECVLIRRSRFLVWYTPGDDSHPFRAQLHAEAEETPVTVNGDTTREGQRHDDRSAHE